MEARINEVGWQSVLQPVLTSSTYNSLSKFVDQARSEGNVYPKEGAVFRAFELTPYKQVKVVILGQDPYHGPNQANGLSFSVSREVKLPPSLRNVYQELASDLGIKPVIHGDLTAWAKQGVLLLNSVLTVNESHPNSHQGKGWEILTNAAIKALNQREQRIVFILWGKAAQAKKVLIDESKHAIISSAHPSPLSSYRGFFGSKPFSRCNALLIESGQQPIDWSLPE